MVKHLATNQLVRAVFTYIKTSLITSHFSPFLTRDGKQIDKATFVMRAVLFALQAYYACLNTAY